ncbi:MAG: hypothetical protein RIR53_559 [Bacteroidota bacterium]
MYRSLRHSRSISYSSLHVPVRMNTFFSSLFALLFSAICVSAQWREVPLPSPYNEGYYLDVFFLPDNPSLGWVCSMQGHVIRTVDAGRTWRGTMIPGANLEYIQFLNQRIGYASGPSGVYRSVDGGATWSDITPPFVVPEKGWGSFWISEREGIYFVGGCATGLQFFYRTTDSGQSWSVSSTNEPNSGLSDGIISENGTGYAVSSGVLWGTNDFGVNWFRINSTGSKRWTEEIAVFGNSILLPTSGTDCNGQTRGVGSLRFSTDGGRTWREFQTRANMFGTFLNSPSRGWGVGDERAVFETTNFGQSWTRRNCGIRGNIDDIWFINDTLGWAVGEGIYVSRLGASESRITISPNVDTAFICAGDSLLLETVGPFAPYTWNDGVVAPSRIVTRPGKYSVQAYDSLTCENVSDTITIRLRSNFEPKIVASKKAICQGDSMTLSVDGPVVSWLWSSGDSTSSVRIGSAGRVTCTTIDTAGCRRQASFDVIVNALPQPVIIPNRKTTICRDEQIVLAADRRYSSYRWNTGETTSTITTSSAGDYVVEVIDSNGCVGRSEPIIVTVLNIRNQAQFIFSTSDPEYTIEDHDVGSLRCRQIRVFNRSDSSDLIMATAQFQGNVFFSVPQGQFPLVIPPSGFGDLTICASAYEVGPISDTLLYVDTCSVIRVPVRSTGLPIEISGLSRCDLPVESSIIRAGTSWRLRAPFPTPADDRIMLVVKKAGTDTRVVTVSVVDVTGIQHLGPFGVEVGSEAEHLICLSTLSVGPYMVTLSVNGQPLASYPIVVSR